MTSLLGACADSHLWANIQAEKELERIDNLSISSCSITAAVQTQQPSRSVLVRLQLAPRYPCQPASLSLETSNNTQYLDLLSPMLTEAEEAANQLAAERAAEVSCVNRTRLLVLACPNTSAPHTWWYESRGLRTGSSHLLTRLQGMPHLLECLELVTQQVTAHSSSTAGQALQGISAGVTSPTVAAPDTPNTARTAQQAPADLQVLVVKLDHMHNRHVCHAPADCDQRAPQLCAATLRGLRWIQSFTTFLPCHVVPCATQGHVRAHPQVMGL
jgi:hypothetical protein